MIMRLSIIGHAGSGKSTLARQISQKLNVPHLQIDSFWFEGRGHRLKNDDETGKEKVRAFIRQEVESFIKGKAWVSDGFYPRVQSLIATRAEKIIFLDISLWRRLLNHTMRMFMNERRDDLTLWDDVKFMSQMIRRTFKYQPVLEEFVKNYNDKSIVLKNYRETMKFVECLSNEKILK